MSERMSKADELRALADRCEREEASLLLDYDIHHAMAARKAESIPSSYTTSLDAVVTLEPKDAQEIVVRTYPNGRAYVRITTKSGKVVYCEGLDKPITEPMARCAAALRARLALLAPISDGMEGHDR